MAQAQEIRKDVIQKSSIELALREIDSHTPCLVCFLKGQCFLFIRLKKHASEYKNYVFSCEGDQYLLNPVLLIIMLKHNSIPRYL